jgi:hypothetical protein
MVNYGAKFNAIKRSRGEGNRMTVNLTSEDFPEMVAFK